MSGLDGNKLHEPDLAGLLVPHEVSVDRLRDALAWLGISRDVIDRCTDIRITPESIEFELRVGPSWQRVAVETRVVHKPRDTFSVEFRVVS